uniref:Uncharacterized protein n=1 Tax=Candidatus Methanogaster sp. ANME-2c ERB4 TaxID=2759911 RepID=A0A7G9YIJ2_9EURY|nr:hypothetical protein CJAOPEPI_00006 [Methanosarcinales archaeon ANME-2c ERB4]QNO47826.1 hypothetical protein GNFHAPIE_00031 [Methanosarcinales archaeon ANME-2c ERB4]
MGYQATIEKVKVISPEILMILEADVVCVTEGSIHTTVSPIFGTLRGDVSPAGSQTVAWYQMEIMGTREAQYALLIPHKGKGVCAIKPMNGKIPQKGILGVGSAHSTDEAG